jgi:hypothetical protein
MIRLIMILTLVLVGCAGGGGASATGGNNVAPPTDNDDNNPVITCKSINDVWNSKTDMERHDFTTIVVGNPSYVNYAFIGSNGAICPAGGQPQTIKVYLSGAVAANAGYSHTFEMQNNNPAVGCIQWNDNATHASALIKVECNKITICRGVGTNCKEFE